MTETLVLLGESIQLDYDKSRGESGVEERRASDRDDKFWKSIQGEFCET